MACRIRLLRFLWLVALCVLAHAVAAQDVDEYLRMRVEQLRETGSLQIDSNAIAAITLIPELYERRIFAPTWTRPEQVDGLIQIVKDSYGEGFDLADYHYAAIQSARKTLFGGGTVPPNRRADLDLLLTDSLIRVGYHLRFGKVNPEQLDPNWNLDREILTDDPVATIQAAIDSDSLTNFRDQLLPRGFFYERLKTALARYRAIERAGGWPVIEQGQTLRPEDIDPRVTALARRLMVTGDLQVLRAEPSDNHYDAALQPAVEAFQQRHGLIQDGIVGPATLAALNVPVERRVEQLRANLERTRWVFEDIEDDFIIVNIAGFRVYLVRDGEVVWTTRAQVGKPFRQTPVFKSSMKYVVLNPTWTVPPTILAQDILPRVRQDTGYLASRNIEIIDNSGQVVDPLSVDWSARRNFPYRFVQGPGPGNALGRVKFIFPNDHFVFLHDTPSRELFERQDRAFSSGCIRVELPLELTSLLLSDEWDRARIDDVMESGETQTVFLEDPLTVMLLYWTTEVDDDGRVFFYADVYDRDRAVIDGLQKGYDATLLTIGQLGE